MVLWDVANPGVAVCVGWRRSRYARLRQVPDWNPSAGGAALWAAPPFAGASMVARAALVMTGALGLSWMRSRASRANPRSEMSAASG